MLRRVPRELRLIFTEPVERAAARLTLTHANGRVVALGTQRSLRPQCYVEREIAAVAGALAALALALSGHAVAVPRWQGVAVTADVLHVIGAGGWLGSLAVLLSAGVPAARRLEPALRNAAVATRVRAFSALIVAAPLSGTGLIAAWRHVGSPSGLWSSEYGRLLLIKVAVACSRRWASRSARLEVIGRRVLK